MDKVNPITLPVPPLQIGDEIPKFNAETHIGAIRSHDVFDGQYGLLVTFRGDFDPTATTEIGALSKLHKEFSDRNVFVLGLSVDTKFNHRRWIEDIQEIQGCTVNFPIVADETAEISRMLGLVRPGQESLVDALTPATLVMLVDFDRRIQMMQMYPSTTGRNFYEVLRAVDAITLTTFQKVGTPANWAQGEDVLILPEISTVQAETMFPQGFLGIRPWFRLTPAPDMDENDHEEMRNAAEDDDE